MDRIIYTGSVFDAFSTAIQISVLLLVLTIFGGVMASRAKHPLVTRLFMGLLGVIMGGTLLFLVGVSLREYAAGPTSEVFMLASKEPQGHRTKGGGTRYTYHVRPAGRTYRGSLEVPESVYHQLTTTECYQFTYYRHRGGSPGITEIRQVALDRCQPGAGARLP